MNHTYAAMQQYHQAGVQSATDVDAHRLIEMLYGALLGKLAKARLAGGLRQRADFGAYIGAALAIIAELRNALDPEQGGEIAERLDALYSFSAQRLVEANLEMDVGPIEEVSSLIGEIKTAWDGIREVTA